MCILVFQNVYIVVCFHFFPQITFWLVLSGKQKIKMTYKKFLVERMIFILLCISKEHLILRKVFERNKKPNS